MSDDQEVEPVEAQVDDVGEEADEEADELTDDEFNEMADEVEADLDASDVADAREKAITEREDRELEVLALDEIVRRETWSELAPGMLSQLTDEQFDQYTSWRDQQPRGEDLETDDEEPAEQGSMLEPATVGPRYHEMSESDFDAHLAELVRGES